MYSPVLPPVFTLSTSCVCYLIGVFKKQDSDLAVSATILEWRHTDPFTHFMVKFKVYVVVENTQYSCECMTEGEEGYFTTEEEPEEKRKKRNQSCCGDWA